MKELYRDVWDKVHGRYRRLYRRAAPTVAHQIYLVRRSSGRRYCGICCRETEWYYSPVLWPGLIREWELESAWVRAINEREGRRCMRCQCSLRSVHLATTISLAIAKMTHTPVGFFRDVPSAVGELPSFRIAELNMAGDLHPYLQEVPGLYYSEYGSSDPKIPEEDLLDLTLADESVDMVVTSDTLEHVSAPARAISEIARVLKPGGAHVFTTPVLWGRPTSRRRAEVVGGSVVHHLPPSYHGTVTRGRAADSLVFYEFGDDVLDVVGDPRLHHDVRFSGPNAAVCTFIGWKVLPPPMTV